MSGRAKAFGALLVIASLGCFAVNFGIWHPWLLAVYLPSWFWNPIGYFFTGKIVGNIPIVSGVLGNAVSHLLAVFYSGILFVIGAFAFIK
jgi:hypothetical protein